MKESASHAKRPSVGLSGKSSASQPPSAPPSIPTSPPNRATNTCRTPFFTEVVRGEICSVIAAGCQFRDAARYVGCTVRAIAELIRCDREFARQIDRALVNRELILISHIRKAAEKSWRAAAWLLAHTVGGRYGEHVLTFDEELDAEESEKFAATMKEFQRPASEPDPEFGPYGPLAKSQGAAEGSEHCANADVEPVKTESMKMESMKVARQDSKIGSGEPASSFEIPGFGKLVPDEDDAGEFSYFKDALSTVTRIPPLPTTPESATTRPTPLPPATSKSGKVSPEQIRESMRALDDYLKS